MSTSLGLIVSAPGTRAMSSNPYAALAFRPRPTHIPIGDPLLSGFPLPGAQYVEIGPSSHTVFWGSIRADVRAVNASVELCCCSMKMSRVNCSVKVSPHEPMGDTHDESQGSAAGGRAQGRRGRPALHCAGSPGVVTERAPGA